MNVRIVTQQGNGIQVVAPYGSYAPTDMMMSYAGEQLYSGQGITATFADGSKMSTSSGAVANIPRSEPIQAGQLKLHLHGPRLDHSVLGKTLPALRVNPDTEAVNPWDISWFHNPTSLKPWQMDMYAWIYCTLWSGDRVMTHARLQEILSEAGDDRGVLELVVDTMRLLIKGDELSSISSNAIAASILNFSHIVSPEDVVDIDRGMNDTINAAERALFVFDVNTVAWAFAKQGFHVFRNEVGDDGSFSAAIADNRSIIEAIAFDVKFGDGAPFPRKVQSGVVFLTELMSQIDKRVGVRQGDVLLLGVAVAILAGDAYLQDMTSLGMGPASECFIGAISMSEKLGIEFDELFIPDVFCAYAQMKLAAIEGYKQSLG